MSEIVTLEGAGRPSFATRPLLRVESLRVSFGRGASRSDVVRDASFTLNTGECLAIVGESGSGKSVTARSLVGLSGRGAQVEAATATYDGHDFLALGEAGWRRIRGREIGYVSQDALVSLDPLRPVGAQVAESVALREKGLSREERRRRVVDLMEAVEIRSAAQKALHLPQQLSGGERQRALIAAGLAARPRILIADEVTTALDATVEIEILALLAQSRAAGTALILISHDLSVVARMADAIMVMRHGEIVESGPADEILHAPRHDYTKMLLDARPAERPKARPRLPRATTPVADAAPVLSAQNLVKRHRSADGTARTAVAGVSFEVRAGETLGVVGASGSGKSTLARLALALDDPDEGSVLLQGAPWTGLAERDRRARRPFISVIWQDPLSSFDPRWSVEQIIEDSLHASGLDRSQRRARVEEALAAARLPTALRRRRPIELSGGQRQRIAIARAIAPRPSIIVCDEPVSALDVSIQAQVLDLLADLQRWLGLAYVFISHDLAVVHSFCDRVLVMSDGRAVEQGPVEDIFLNPRDDYTRRLVASARFLTPPREPAAEAPRIARSA